MTIGESTNIRKEPSTKADLVKRMKAKGTPVEVQSAVTNKEGELWYSIVFGAYTGYVRADLLEEISVERYNERQAAMGGMPVGGLFVLSPEQAEIVGGATAPGARIGNTKTSKYHMPACEYLPETVYQVSFASRDAAEMAGYVPCKVCEPD